MLGETLPRKSLSLGKLLEACSTKTGCGECLSAGLTSTSQWGLEVMLIANSPDYNSEHVLRARNVPGTLKANYLN